MSNLTNESLELVNTIKGTKHVRALHLELPTEIIESVTEGIADAILAAGYRRPRTITTAEELRALKLPAVINAQNGGPARVDYYYGPSGQKYVEYIFGEDDHFYSLESFAEFMDAATVLCEDA